MKVKYTKIRNANYNISNLKNSSKIKKPKRFTKARNFKTSKNYKKKTKNKRGGEDPSSSWLTKAIGELKSPSTTDKVYNETGGDDIFPFEKRLVNLRQSKNPKKKKYIIERNPYILEIFRLEKTHEGPIDDRDLKGDSQKNLMKGIISDNLRTFLEYTIKDLNNTTQRGGMDADYEINLGKKERIKEIFKESTEKLQAIEESKNDDGIIFKTDGNEYHITINDFNILVRVAREGHKPNITENFIQNNTVYDLNNLQAFIKDKIVQQYFCGYQEASDLNANNRMLLNTLEELDNNKELVGGGDNSSFFNLKGKVREKYTKYLNKREENLNFHDIYNYLYNLLVNNDLGALAHQIFKLKVFLEPQFKDLRTDLYKYLYYINYGKYLENLIDYLKGKKGKNKLFLLNEKKIEDEIEAINKIINNYKNNPEKNIFWNFKIKTSDDAKEFLKKLNKVDKKDEKDEKFENYMEVKKNIKIIERIIKKINDKDKNNPIKTDEERPIRVEAKEYIEKEYKKSKRILNYLFWGEKKAEGLSIIYDDGNIIHYETDQPEHQKILNECYFFYELGVMRDEKKKKKNKYLYQINLITNRYTRYGCLFWAIFKISLTAITAGALSGLDVAASGLDPATQMSINFRFGEDATATAAASALLTGGSSIIYAKGFGGGAAALITFGLYLKTNRDRKRKEAAGEEAGEDKKSINDLLVKYTHIKNEILNEIYIYKINKRNHVNKHKLRSIGFGTTTMSRFNYDVIESPEKTSLFYKNIPKYDLYKELQNVCRIDGKEEDCKKESRFYKGISWLPKFILNNYKVTCVVDSTFRIGLLNEKIQEVDKQIEYKKNKKKKRANNPIYQ